MEAATKDNDIEMASGTSSADAEPYSSISEFQLIDCLYYDAVKGDIEKFEQHSKRLDQLLTPNGNTILHIHITTYESMNFVTGILGMCPDLLWKANKRGETLLHMAARHGHFDVVKYILQECKTKPYKNQYDDQEHGITPTRRMLQTRSHDAKDTALHEAVRYDDHNHLDVVQLLTKEDPALTYEANAVGETPLYLTAARNNISTKEMVEILLRAGEGIHKSKQDWHGWTPLHFAAHLGYTGILIKLLNKDDSAVYTVCNEGKTALHVAAGLGRVDIMEGLIYVFPGCCELVDKRGRNVLHFAVESRNKKAVKYLLDCKWLGNLINEKDENGNTPLLHVASIGYYHMRHPKVDMQVFNNQNRNAMDIILGNYNWASEIMPDSIFWLIENYNVNPDLRKIVSENENIGVGRDEGSTVISKIIEDGEVENEGKMSRESNDGKRKNRSISNFKEKARENELITATLIATVTFAAGFTVPGGFVEDKRPDLGAAILIRNIAFRTFVILNTMSMFFSCLAVFNHLAESSATHICTRHERTLQTDEAPPNTHYLCNDGHDWGISFRHMCSVTQ